MKLNILAGNMWYFISAKDCSCHILNLSDIYKETDLDSVFFSILSSISPVKLLMYYIYIYLVLIMINIVTKQFYSNLNVDFKP